MKIFFKGQLTFDFMFAFLCCYKVVSYNNL